MNRGKILFVDDESGVLSAVKRVFRRADVDVFTATSGPEGLAMLREGPVHVVVSDQRMCGMSGTEFLKQVRQEFPNTVRCILSGYADVHAILSAVNDGNVYRFIAKPWDDAELRRVLLDCVDVALATEADQLAQAKLQDRARLLERADLRNAELINLQKSLLNSSREVLEQLPVAVVAIDGEGRLIYTNKMFSQSFGHLPGAGLGDRAGDPWLRICKTASASGPVELVVDQMVCQAHISAVDIGGLPHSLIAIPILTAASNGAAA